MTGFDQIVRLPDRQGAPSERWGAQERKKVEIEDLALRFRNEVKAEILKHRGSKAIGVVGSFVVNIEARATQKNSTQFARALTRRPFFLPMKLRGKSMP